MVTNITPIDSERSEVNPAALLKDLKGKPYLGAHEAIYWFTVEHPAPEGRIITSIDFDHKAVRAEIYVGDVLVATGHSIGDGNKSLEKLESAAVRRALANAGYGTIAAMAEVDDEDATKTQARAAIAANEIPTEVAREKMGSGKTRKIDTSKDAPESTDAAPETYPNLRIKLRDLGIGNFKSVEARGDLQGMVRVTFNSPRNAGWVRRELVKDGFAEADLGEMTGLFFDVKWSEG